MATAYDYYRTNYPGWGTGQVCIGFSPYNGGLAHCYCDKASVQGAPKPDVSAVISMYVQSLLIRVV